MAKKVILKTTVEGEVHQIIAFSGGGTGTKDRCRVIEASTGQEITKRDYSTEEILVLSKSEGQDNAIIFMKSPEGKLVHLDRPLSKDEAAHLQQYKETGQDVVFLVGNKRRDNRFSRSAPSGGRGRLQVKAPPLDFSLS